MIPFPPRFYFYLFLTWSVSWSGHFLSCFIATLVQDQHNLIWNNLLQSVTHRSLSDNDSTDPYIIDHDYSGKLHLCYDLKRNSWGSNAWRNKRHCWRHSCTIRKTTTKRLNVIAQGPDFVKQMETKSWLGQRHSRYYICFNYKKM